MSAEERREPGTRVYSATAIHLDTPEEHMKDEVLMATRAVLEGVLEHEVDLKTLRISFDKDAFGSDQHLVVRATARLP